MLCARCDAERHRMWLESRQSVSETRSTSSAAQAGSICCPVVDDDNAECGAIVSDVNAKFEGIIVNELLCYVYNRIDILTNDDLVNIVSHFYDESEINSALLS